MAWLTPDTEWSAGERLTYSDFNRICGNLNELAGDSALKTTWSEDDFLDLAAGGGPDRPAGGGCEPGGCAH